MSDYAIITIVVIYLMILFLIAFFAEKNGRSKWVNNPYIYTLSLAVYCSAWTYYGSVGIAANSGMGFLAIYLGPVIAFPLWIVVLRKIIRISKQQKISSIADFISLRYGNNRFLGALITVICLLGTIPYISLQLKAISETYQIMVASSTYGATNVYDDSAFYIALTLAIFAAFFGTQRTDASEKHKGIIVTVAFESILKLVFFLLLGIYVTFYLFNGTVDIYQKMLSNVPNFKILTKMNGVAYGFDWMFTIMLSFIAIFLLPRQFQVSVLENIREKHLKKAIWLFPLYLLLFNFFVIFVAWGGKLALGNSMNAEYYALLLPLHHENTILALLVFLGGLSAVVSMVVVSTLALSTMISNNLIIPYRFIDKFIKGYPERNTFYIKMIRRISIFFVVLLAYLFYIKFSIELPLYSIGLISFVIIAQLAPAFFIGLFWNRGSSKAAIFGIIVGMIITTYTLVLPFTLEVLFENKDFINKGFLGVEILKPYNLFGIGFLTPLTHTFFWSLFFNTFTYLIISVSFKGNYRERNYAEMFVDSTNFSSLQDSALVWKGEAYVSDIKNVLSKFLGKKRASRAMKLFFLKYQLPLNTEMADARLINFSEKLLTGTIGGASAKILISNVVKEEEVSLREVLKILEESKEALALNKILKQKSNQLLDLTEQLKEANKQLIVKDKQKDEFLDTVAHELKTPVTGIRAATELLIDEEREMPMEIKNKFLQNILQDADRLYRLINNILDLEKLETGRERLDLKINNIEETIKKAINGIEHIVSKKNIVILNMNKISFKFKYDEDRILQVLTNLLSNAIKFCNQQKGEIIISSRLKKSFIEVYVKDNGSGISEKDQAYIFDKFYQCEHQNVTKPKGSGLGLAISKQIIEKHRGEIWVEKTNKKEGVLAFKIPFN
ncbi:Two-component system sensor histidine kinase [Tenacibaculum maritimum]|uniref:sensor histidine kinase n=1 Tax=Tenacibaculum maritimum TaxID=107401 RepID=UPI0012E4FF40|nr:sensor histidine kinase [Tenacibaculum maritimum]CAA0199414.1 Two-component system sensor histidine kinase [Tenacibaculum maritimum]CAA0253963.1 Two-component system sensor histidine kinase [Tenacibaculum maritimum]CAA0258243.1 Two-component system sensor histidine kinase [Tenacibaculum maritimum]